MMTELHLLIQAYSLQGATVSFLQNKIAEVELENASLKNEINRLKELLAANQQQRFGKKSETNNTASEAPVGEEKEVTVKAHIRKKKAKRLFGTDHLPHYQKFYDLDNKLCTTCQHELHLIGEETTKQLEIIPVRRCIVEHVQKKYTCRHCQTMVMSPKPLAPIPKAIAGASMLTDVVINKYQFQQPLYRQAKMLKQDGITLPDNTLNHWVIHIGFQLEPIYQAMWVILKQRYLQVDETPVKILKPDKKGYLWTYYAPHIGSEKGLVVFELSETRSGSVAQKRLQSFSGALQTDGYSGYRQLRHRQGISGLGCLTHARRKFKEVVKISADSSGLAAEMIARLKPLYRLEEKWRDHKISFHTRKRLRQQSAFPILKEIRGWLLRIKPTVPPKSKLGNAIDYTIKQWPYIIKYIRHGSAEIDTNGVENKIRDIALGKRNWLFIGNKKTGVIHAYIFSLIVSCTLNNLNARVYMHYLITKLHDVRRGLADPMTLLPHTIDHKVLEAFANEQIEFAKKVFNSTNCRE